MRRFFCRLPVYLLFLAELIVILPLLTISYYGIHIKEDKTGRIIDDGQMHELGVMELTHTVEPAPEEPPEDRTTPGGSPSETADPGEAADPAGEDANPGDTETEDQTDPEGPEEQDPPEPPVITCGGIPASDPVDSSYFDDVVFIGDSVSLKLQYYVRDQRKSDPEFLGKAQFLTAGSFSYINALTAVTEESVHPTYQGTKMLLENAVAACGAKKLYIMLGMNDIAGGRYDGTLDNLTTVISRILKKAPDVTFYFQSVTPRMGDSVTRKLNNEIIRTYNQRLLEYCEENGYYFIDVYSALCDENGDLPAAYCSDPVSLGGMGIHFTNEACAVWIDYLYTHTA